MRGATYRLLVDSQYFADNGGFIITTGTYNGGYGALVPKGVRVQLDRIELEKDIETSRIYYMGHFVDGPFAGRRIEMKDTTTLTANYEGYERDPKVLELVP